MPIYFVVRDCRDGDGRDFPCDKAKGRKTPLIGISSTPNVFGSQRRTIMERKWRILQKISYFILGAGFYYWF
ncbi:hypothetical protein EXN32_12290 [Agrobacterium tumefaciens]|uniref:hypothetical protein n=1 Tax=Agrobacterium TaxID=357 RepID=UPI00115DF7CA|nr:MULTISPECIES: hypothetical protein [Agrobacterium]MDA5243126.1 hypothetical protein [Agrobacterium sp. MAFF310724]MDA5247322.1 hypothetical protein [Agrobacterium sp. MAFF210268]TRB16267.1 hypothetical protein EXN32_12290 [Agrobacterium tumefaciens]WCA57597.1 hypothetical protein G6M16_007795 [Agrobacterium tumefaciens]